MVGWQKLIHHDNERRLSCVDREEFMWCSCWSVNWPVNRPFTFCWTAPAAVTVVYHEMSVDGSTDSLFTRLGDSWSN